MSKLTKGKLCLSDS